MLPATIFALLVLGFLVGSRLSRSARASTKLERAAVGLLAVVIVLLLAFLFRGLWASVRGMH